MTQCYKIFVLSLSIAVTQSACSKVVRVVDVDSKPIAGVAVHTSSGSLGGAWSSKLSDERGRLYVPDSIIFDVGVLFYKRGFEKIGYPLADEVPEIVVLKASVTIEQDYHWLPEKKEYDALMKDETK